MRKINKENQVYIGHVHNGIPFYLNKKKNNSIAMKQGGAMLSIYPS